MIRLNASNVDRALREGEVLDTTDIDVAAAAASAAQIPLTVELSRPTRQFRFSLREVALPSMTAAFVRFRCGSRYTVHADSPGHYYHLNVPLLGATEVRHGDRHAFAVGGLRGIVISPRRPTRFVSEGDFKELTLNIGRAVLERHLEVFTGVEIRDPIEFAPGIDLRCGGGARLMTLLPTLLEYSRFGECPAELALAEEAVLDTILLDLDHDHRAVMDSSNPGEGRRLQRRAEEYIQANAGFPLRIGDVARAVRVSTRTLQRAFQRWRGCTPGQFLKRVRLDHAMQLLRQGDPGTTVTAAAMQSGFNHLGQFSVDFRQRFRQSPSVTLRQVRA